MVNRWIDLPKNFIKKIHQKVGQKNSSKIFVKKFVKKIGHSICKNKGEKNRQKFTSKRDQPYVCVPVNLRNSIRLIHSGKIPVSIRNSRFVWVC